MPENDDEGCSKLLCRKFNASNLGGCHNVTGNPYDKQVTESLVENNLRRDTCVRAAKDDCKWFLPPHQLIATRFIDKSLGFAIAL